MGKTPPPSEVPDDKHRCNRNDGKTWRCFSLRFGESRFCEKHCNYYLQKKAAAAYSRARSRSGLSVSDPPVFEKKTIKKKNLDTNGGGDEDSRVLGKKRKRDRKSLKSVKMERDNNGVRVSCKSRKIEKGEFFERFEKSSEMSGKNGVRGSCSSSRKRTIGIAKIVSQQAKVENVGEIDSNDTRTEEQGVVRVMELGQIWAFSRDGDGHPRCYARIDRIFPFPPLVRVTPLVHHPVTVEEMALCENGFSLACGMFKISDSSFVKEISAFSHQVVAVAEGETGCFYRVFPMKGEVWAIYVKVDDTGKNFEYKLVEVVYDFRDGDGVDVFALIKVEDSGGRVYKREEYQGFCLIREFKRGCISMFSHRVSASRVVEDGEVLWKLH